MRLQQPLQRDLLRTSVRVLVCVCALAGVIGMWYGVRRR